MSFFVVEGEECEATGMGLYSKLYISGPRFVLSAAVFGVGGQFVSLFLQSAMEPLFALFEKICFWGQVVHRAVIDRQVRAVPS